MTGAAQAGRKHRRSRSLRRPRLPRRAGPAYCPFALSMNLWPHGMGTMIDRRSDCFRGRYAARLAVVALVGLLTVCGGTEDKAGVAKAPNAAVRSERPSHEACGEAQGHV